jgi:hypothetical protein
MKPEKFLKRLRKSNLLCGVSDEGRLVLGGPEEIVKQAREALGLLPDIEPGALLILAKHPNLPGCSMLADMIEEREAIAGCSPQEAARLLTLGPQPKDVYMKGEPNETN